MVAGLLYSLSFPLSPTLLFSALITYISQYDHHPWFYPMSCITILINFASPVSVLFKSFISFIGFFYLHLSHLYHHWIEYVLSYFSYFLSFLFFFSYFCSGYLFQKEILHLVFTSFLLFWGKYLDTFMYWDRLLLNKLNCSLQITLSLFLSHINFMH